MTSRRWVVTRASTRGSWSVLATCGRDRSAVAAGQTGKVPIVSAGLVYVLKTMQKYSCYMFLDDVQVGDGRVVEIRSEDESSTIRVSSGSLRTSM